MRQRSGGISSTLPRQSIHPIYESFQPMSERQEEEEATIILVHLPGFVKERIRITFVNSSRTVRVQGERPVGENRWSRFNETFPVPENCVSDKIQGKFHQGILTITMPKQVIARVGPRKKAITTQRAPSPPKSSAQPKPQKVQEEIQIPPPKPTSTTGVEKQKEEKAVMEPKVQKDVEDVPPKATSTATTGSKQRLVDIAQSQRAEKVTTEQKAQEGQDVTRPKANYIVVQKGIDKKETNEGNEKPKETKEAEKAVEKNVVKGKERDERSTKLGIGESSTASKVSWEAMEKKERYAGGGKYKEKPNKEVVIAEKGTGLKEVMDSATNRVKNLAEKVNEEEKQMLINVGAAVLVIVALGVYVSYSYGSAGRAEN